MNIILQPIIIFSAILSGCSDPQFVNGDQEPTENLEIEANPKAGQIVKLEQSADVKSEVSPPTKKENKKTPTAEDILVTCKNTTLRSLTLSLDFPERAETCVWGEQEVVDGTAKEVLSENGNRSKRNGWIRAREQLSREIDVPAGAIVCGLDISSETDQIHFDDHFAITVQGVMVAGSKVLADALEADEQGLKTWDWPRVRGEGDQGTKMEDLGNFFLTGNGELPNHDQRGLFSLNMSFSRENDDITDSDEASDTLIASLYSRLSDNDKIEISMIATGDNDNGDCYHSGGVFNVTLSYVDKK